MRRSASARSCASRAGSRSTAQSRVSMESWSRRSDTRTSSPRSTTSWGSMGHPRMRRSHRRNGRRSACSPRRSFDRSPRSPCNRCQWGPCFLADDDDVACALRMDGYTAEPRRTAIPIGVYHAGGIDAPVHLDADFLLGPEAAHLAVTGVSGLATKTSAVEWLLASIFAHFPPAKESIAAVCFNVKGSDLCFLDQPATDLGPADLALYEKLGVPPTPFARVRYFAPYRTEWVHARHAAVARGAGGHGDSAGLGAAGSHGVRRRAAES